MIHAGALNCRLQFDKVSRAPDSQGGYAETWTELCTVWGKYRQLSGRELLLQQQVNPLVTVEAQIRYRTDITTDRRMQYNHKVHNIIEVIDVDNRHTELLIKCEIVHSNQ